MNFIVRLLIVTLPIILMGCSNFGAKVFPANDSKYMRATSIPPLRMPPGVSSAAFRNDYPVSSQGYPGDQKNPGVMPPGL